MTSSSREVSFRRLSESLQGLGIKLAEFRQLCCLRILKRLQLVFMEPFLFAVSWSAFARSKMQTMVLSSILHRCAHLVSGVLQVEERSYETGTYEDMALRVHYLPLTLAIGSQGEDDRRRYKKQTVDVAYLVELKEMPRRIDPLKLLNLRVSGNASLKFFLFRFQKVHLLES